MPSVICPVCGATALAIPSGTTVEIKGKLDLKRCQLLREFAHAGEHISDPLECEAMEAAVERVLEEVGADALTSSFDVPDDVLEPWRAGQLSRRRFERWPLRRPAQAAAAGRRQRCEVRDISPSGARLAAPDMAGLAPGHYLVLDLDGFERLSAEVRHVDRAHDEAGVMFLHGASGETRLAEWLGELQAAPALPKAAPVFTGRSW